MKKCNICKGCGKTLVLEEYRNGTEKFVSCKPCEGTGLSPEALKVFQENLAYNKSLKKPKSWLDLY